MARTSRWLTTQLVAGWSSWANAFASAVAVAVAVVESQPSATRWLQQHDVNNVLRLVYANQQVAAAAAAGVKAGRDRGSGRRGQAKAKLRVYFDSLLIGHFHREQSREQNLP